MATKGFVRNIPPLNILGAEDIESVHRGMLEVLWTTGVRMEHERSLKLLESAGCKVDYEQRRVRMPPALVEECIRRAPSSFPLRARDPSRNLMMGGNTLYFAPAPGQHTVDLDTWEPRSPTRNTLPPSPPSPPSGPPKGTNFSRRKLTTPLPPSPPLT